MEGFKESACIGKTKLIFLCNGCSYLCMQLVKTISSMCGDAPVVLPPLVVVDSRKNRRKCNFFIFLPLFDSSRLLLATSSEGKFMQTLMSRSHG